MKFANHTTGVPAKFWIDEEEYLASELLVSQTDNVRQMPPAFHHLALMPDAHPGYGMPIGGVLALSDAICPGAVGYDIGCGMYAFKTTLDAAEVAPRVVEVHRAIRKLIPVGEGGSRGGEKASLPSAVAVHQKVEGKWNTQLGTLGGGNHFIELDADEHGNVWCVIHSGSRGPGHAIAGYYMNLAKSENKRWYTPLADNELAFLPSGTQHFDCYVEAMLAALEYAYRSRELMAEDIISVLDGTFGCEVIERINVHHNLASLESHFGRNVWVHRKGATRAREGERIVIPGNMGQGTAICVGLGNPDSFCSSSHGAGRKMSRSEARSKLVYGEERAKLDAQGVVLSAGRDGALDEMPAAYKDFDVVMAAQTDLVTVVERLAPIGVIKG